MTRCVWAVHSRAQLLLHAADAPPSPKRLSRLGVGAAYPNPRWWCRLAVAVVVPSMQCVCVAILVSAYSANVGGCALHVPRRPLVGPIIASLRRAQVARQRAPCEAIMRSCVCVHAHHGRASQALPREPAVVPACGFAANGTTLIAGPPELPSPALTACLCSAVSMSMAHQHCAHDRLGAAVPAWAANRANPFSSIIAVRLAGSQRYVILLRATVGATLIVRSQTFSSMRASPHHGCAMGEPRDPALDASVAQGRTVPPLIKCSSVPGHRSSTSGSSVTNTSCQYPLRSQLAVLDIGAVTTGRPSDRGPRRAATTATLTHSGHYAPFCAFRIHRYGVRSAHGTFVALCDASRFAARRCERCVL
jgi:hypothetical protein